MKAYERMKMYQWLYDLLVRAGHEGVTREEVNARWMAEHKEWSGGGPMSRATFFNYRREVEALYGVEVRCRRLTTGLVVYWIEL